VTIALAKARADVFAVLGSIPMRRLVHSRRALAMIAIRIIVCLAVSPVCGVIGFAGTMLGTWYENGLAQWAF
jgi:hypothetical protein